MFFLRHRPAGSATQAGRPQRQAGPASTATTIRHLAAARPGRSFETPDVLRRHSVAAQIFDERRDVTRPASLSSVYYAGTRSLCTLALCRSQAQRRTAGFFETQDARSAPSRSAARRRNGAPQTLRDARRALCTLALCRPQAQRRTADLSRCETRAWPPCALRTTRAHDGGADFLRDEMHSLGCVDASSPWAINGVSVSLSASVHGFARAPQSSKLRGRPGQSIRLLSVRLHSNIQTRDVRSASLCSACRYTVASQT